MDGIRGAMQTPQCHELVAATGRQRLAIR